ncbi:MAG: DUF418 domain-containing protein [Xanthomonadales bacterium]|nr:DUF418 domain-containing protein [Xanthomonadaceae bacterium]MBN8223684.1 DUF418 domain-containing protein [Xanthomonadales bacterium]MCA0198907.1 DUF418 domain-containing protein [Pseudomonadota bacterium]HRF83374.1 DUF418 domain-containing protein [Pseudoxanthomonas sp.]
MNATPLAPIAPAERIAALDVLRGFALVGILLMNMEAFAGPMVRALTGLDPTLTGVNRLTDGLIYFFVQGKFFTLFSLLFGMGFAMMVMRAEAAGRPFARLYWRRSLALLGIGLVHALLIWSGDVLVIYALLSIPLLAFRELSARWLAWLGLAVYLAAPAMLLGIGLMSLWVPGWDALMAQGAEHSVALEQAQEQTYASGTYAMAVAQRVRDFGFMLSGLMVFGAMVFGMFLIGAAFMRSGAIQNPQLHVRLYQQLRWSVLALGLLAMLASFVIQPTVSPATFDFHTGLAQALATMAGLLMCLGYLAWVMRGLEVPRAAHYLNWLAPAGRMALTNYLVQSIVCTLVFYGYGLGFFEHLPRFWQVPFALGLFAVQVLYSQWWLQRFRFGPAEWLWRSITYWQLQPMRRVPA